MVLYNAHSTDFVHKPLSYCIIGKRPHLKYAYLSDFNEGRCEYFFDFTESSLLSKVVIAKLRFLSRPIIFLEIIVWALVNGISLWNIRFPWNKSSRSSKRLLIFSYKSCVRGTKKQLEDISKFRIVLVHLSHYMIRTEEKCDFIKSISTKTILLGDSDYKKNPYYNRYFSNHAFEILPFAPAERFREIKPFDARKTRVFASGTIHNLACERPTEYYSDFRGFFGAESYHTVRRRLKKLKHPLLDCAYSDWSEQKNPLEKCAYFEGDLVQMFNDYKFVCYGSELSGAPSISNLEAISCGCVALLDRRYVIGLPLIEGVDFIHVDEHTSDLEKEIDRAIAMSYNQLRDSLEKHEPFRSRYHCFINSQLKGIFIENFGS